MLGWYSLLVDGQICCHCNFKIMAFCLICIFFALLCFLQGNFWLVVFWVLWTVSQIFQTFKHFMTGSFTKVASCFLLDQFDCCFCLESLFQQSLLFACKIFLFQTVCCKYNFSFLYAFCVCSLFQHPHFVHIPSSCN